MLDKLWERIGEGIAERWLITIYSPALLFVAGGILTYGAHHDIAQILDSWTKLAVVIRVATVVVALFGILSLADLIERVQIFVIRICEGYWPGFADKLRLRLAMRWGRRILKKNDELQVLIAASDDKNKLRQYRLDAEIAHLPVREERFMPTLLGNLLSASEEYSDIRYGLNAIVCWPRLYPLLPDSLRESINEARGKLNESARLLSWSLLFSVWVIWQWWALIGLPVAWLAYRGMVSACGIYGDLIRSAFDLYRFDLYKSLHWKLPKGPVDEEKNGKALSRYLFRGVEPKDQLFEHNY